MKYLIEDLFAKFKMLYGDLTPINKFHHLIHYPLNILENGPPTGHWCMRYESFHNIFKRMCHLNCNFINISKSVATHLQLFFCISVNEQEFCEWNVSFGPKLGISELKKKPLELSNIINSRESFSPTSWCCVNSFEFREKSVILVSKWHLCENELPSFAIIRITEEMDGRPVAIAEKLETLDFSSHYNACNVSFLPTNTADLSFVELTSVTYKPLWISKSFVENEREQSCVVPRSNM